jgi:hypothetical protein
MQQVKDASVDVETAQAHRSQAIEPLPPRKRDAAAWWRALSGMAMSLALGCVIVMLEFTSQAAHRAARMHRHAEALHSRLSRLEAEITDERARIATTHRELAASEALRALLRAPDAGMLALSPPTSPAAKGRHPVAAGTRPQATLATGVKERRAVLIVAGLKPLTDDTRFVLWWSVARGEPIRAAEFRTAADGSALVMAAMPPGVDVTGAMVTVERAAKDSAANGVESLAQHGPAGPVQLRGTLVR